MGRRQSFGCGKPFSNPDRMASATSVCLWLVDDLKAHMAGLAQRVVTSQSATETQNVLTATVIDPDGNRITFAEALSTAT